VLPTVLESAVSLLFVPASKKEEATEYGSGFVILSHNNYSYVFTRYFFKDEHHVNAGTIYVQFYESCSITEANIICNNSEFMVLTVEDKENKGKPITLAQERATYEKCCTLGTLSGTKMHASAKVPLEHFMGAIGAYFGQLITPDCRASSHKRRSAIQTVEGSQSYFMVTCPYKDKMVDLDNIDKPGHTCTRIIGAAVFRSTGDIIGAISSPTTYPDVKYGLHVEEMIGLIGNMCLPSSGKENEEEFKMLDWEVPILLIQTLRINSYNICLYTI
jgi:hypothetical protein